MATIQLLNQLAPSAKQSKALGADIAAGPTGDPIFVVNLLKFRETPKYPNGESAPTGVETGRDAFYQYLEEAQGALDAFGGELVYAGKITALRIGEMRIGETDWHWDEIAILKYPSSEHWAKMLKDGDWQSANKHREAGLDGQLNIETVASTSPVHASAMVK